MAEAILGLDFGTTNSLAAYIDSSDVARSLTNVEDDRPHPSTVWYRGGEIVVGREARDHLEAGTEAISGAFVLSPKRLLRKEAPVDVEGTPTDPRDIVKEVLKFIKDDAASTRRGASAKALTRAVMTIPVELDGEGRGRLREAARKAGVAVEQFVHEPLAALYGWLRSQADYHQKLAQLEGKRVLVFDWGGGTLDLTLCLIRGRQMVQLGNAGDNEVGGDFFDDVLRNRETRRRVPIQPRDAVMTARRKPVSESDLASRSKRQGGLHSLADAHHGPRSGFDGQLMRAIWGDDPLDFERMVEAEAAGDEGRREGGSIRGRGRGYRVCGRPPDWPTNGQSPSVSDGALGTVLISLANGVAKGRLRYRWYRSPPSGWRP